MLAWRFLGAGLLTALLLPACGDDTAPPPPPPPRDGGRDTGAGDTGSPPDGAMDSAIVDSTLPDGDVPTGDCRITDMFDVHTEPATMFREASLTVGGGADGFLVGYAFTTDGRKNFFTRHVPTTGTTVGAEVNVSQLSDPLEFANGGAVTGMGSSDWLMVWPDNRLLPGDTFRGLNIQAATAGAGGTSPSASAPVSAEERTTNERPAIQVTADGYLVVYNHKDRGALAVDEAYAATLGPDGSLIGTPTAVAGMTGMSGSVALGSLIDGVAAAWVQDVDDTGAMRNVRVLAMDRDGTPRGTATTITSTPNAVGTVDFAGVVDGGGVVYDYRVGGSRLEVRYRAIDVDGMTVTEPRSLIPAGAQGRAPAIDIIGGNALVAYRGIDRDDEPGIQLVVVDGFGTELGRTTVAPLADWTRGEVHLAFTPMGEGLVVWNDMGASDYKISAARIDCSEAP